MRAQGKALGRGAEHNVGCGDGKIELIEPPPEDAAGPIVVTFLAASGVDLAERGIDPSQAADLRRRLATFAEDWQRPEMDVYDAL